MRAAHATMRSMAKPRMRLLLGSVLCLLCAFCNTTVGGDLAHVAPPNANGKPCNNDVECASDHCAGVTVFGPGSCERPANGAIEIDGDCSGGAPCVADATCEDGICVANSKACAALLARCAVDNDCCSGACASPPGYTQPEGTCTGGGGMCADEGSSCIVDSDCCAGRCDFRISTGPRRGECSTTCKGFDDACEIGDCCNGYCSALPTASSSRRTCA
jgi:hypothetical protein